MILLESGHHMLREALELRLGEDKAEFRERNPVEGMIIADFDDVSYCIKVAFVVGLLGYREAGTQAGMEGGKEATRQADRQARRQSGRVRRESSADSIACSCSEIADSVCHAASIDAGRGAMHAGTADVDGGPAGEGRTFHAFLCHARLRVGACACPLLARQAPAPRSSVSRRGVSRS